MPKIQTQDAPVVATRGVTLPTIPTTAGDPRGVAQIAQALGTAGAVLGQIAIRQKRTAAQTLLMESANRMNEETKRLGLKVESSQLADAPEAERTAHDEWDEKVNAIAAEITNEKLREKFTREYVDKSRTEFQLATGRHVLRENQKRAKLAADTYMVSQNSLVQGAGDARQAARIIRDTEVHLLGASGVADDDDDRGIWDAMGIPQETQARMMKEWTSGAIKEYVLSRIDMEKTAEARDFYDEMNENGLVLDEHKDEVLKALVPTERRNIAMALNRDYIDGLDHTFSAADEDAAYDAAEAEEDSEMKRLRIDDLDRFFSRQRRTRRAFQDETFERAWNAVDPANPDLVDAQKVRGYDFMLPTMKEHIEKRVALLKKGENTEPDTNWTAVYSVWERMPLLDNSGKVVKDEDGEEVTVPSDAAWKANFPLLQIRGIVDDATFNQLRKEQNTAQSERQTGQRSAQSTVDQELSREISMWEDKYGIDLGDGAKAFAKRKVDREVEGYLATKPKGYKLSGEEIEKFAADAMVTLWRDRKWSGRLKKPVPRVLADYDEYRDENQEQWAIPYNELNSFQRALARDYYRDQHDLDEDAPVKREDVERAWAEQWLNNERPLTKHYEALRTEISSQVERLEAGDYDLPPGTDINTLDEALLEINEVPGPETRARLYLAWLRLREIELEDARQRKDTSEPVAPQGRGSAYGKSFSGKF